MVRWSDGRGGPTGKRYCLVDPSGALDGRRVQAMHHWIVQQAQALVD